MKIKKIVLGLLSCVLASGSFVVPKAAKIPTIVYQQGNLSGYILKMCCDRSYAGKKVALFNALLDYCYRARLQLRDMTGRTLAHTVYDYISAKCGLSYVELNSYDRDAVNKAENYDDLVNNLAVMYLAYANIGECKQAEDERENRYRGMELFLHVSPEEIESTRTKDTIAYIEARKINDPIRVANELRRREEALRWCVAAASSLSTDLPIAAPTGAVPGGAGAAEAANLPARPVTAPPRNTSRGESASGESYKPPERSSTTPPGSDGSSSSSEGTSASEFMAQLMVSSRLRDLARARSNGSTWGRMCSGVVQNVDKGQEPLPPLVFGNSERKD